MIQVSGSIPQIVLEEIERAVGGVLGLMVALPMTSAQLGLNANQIHIFCENTPDGEELWNMFTARRDSKETSEDYNFTHFMKEVLAKARYPLETKTSPDVFSVLLKNIENPNGFKFDRQEDIMPYDMFKEKAASELLHLSRKRGRTWKQSEDFQIGVSQEQFFKCSLRDNEEMTTERQGEELKKSEKILCVGCSRTKNRMPLCIGHMLRSAWTAKHPDQHRRSF
jgi:hypothetical protein